MGGTGPSNFEFDLSDMYFGGAQGKKGQRFHSFGNGNFGQGGIDPSIF